MTGAASGSAWRRRSAAHSVNPIGSILRIAAEQGIEAEVRASLAQNAVVASVGPIMTASLEARNWWSALCRCIHFCRRRCDGANGIEPKPQTHTFSELTLILSAWTRM